jgi:DNA-binding transcriptional LysR family regulator
MAAVAEERNFTRAAERLQLTQPALSRTIAALERLLRTTLVFRNRRTVQLTAAGSRFLPHAQRVLAVLTEAVDAVGGDVPPLRVGFTWGSAEYTAPIVRAFDQAHPGVRVDIRRYDDTLAGLADGRTHVGFCPATRRTPGSAPSSWPSNRGWWRYPPTTRSPHATRSSSPISPTKRS